jgi:geranylgeranyl diphosphate synthase type II
MDDINVEITKRAAAIEERIRPYMPTEPTFQKTVFEAMEYSIFAGGKRLRPMLMEASYRMFGGNEASQIEPFMAAIEMIHTYSLVHDDLPAMDNDDYRRGKKTTHAVYGEAMGILTGDALLNYAYETVAKALVKSPDERTAKAFYVLANKAGIYGMVGGQVVDVETEKKNQSFDPEKLDFIYRLKTSALLEASLMIGAILAGATESEIKKMEDAGTKLGLAFQIQDDILDVTSTQEVLGKPIGSDEENDKATYVAFAGLQASREEVSRLTDEAVEILDTFSTNKEYTFLHSLFLQLLDRQY